MSEQVGLTTCFPGYKIQDMTHLHNVNGTIIQPEGAGGELVFFFLMG